MTRIIILTLIFASTILSVHGQRSLSLQQCIEIAQENSLKIKQAYLLGENAKIQEKFARQQLMPSLNANNSLSYHLGRSINPTTNSYLAETFISQGINLNTALTLFNGFKLKNRIKQAIADKQASKLEIEQMKKDIALLVTNMYLAILYTEENIANAEAQYKVTKDQLDKMQKLIDAGLQAPAEAINLEAQLLSEKQKVITYQNELKKNYLNLKNILLLEDNDNIIIVKPSLDMNKYDMISKYTFDEIYATAIQHYPAYQASQSKIQSARMGEKIARGSLLPSINLYAALSTNYADKAKKVTYEPTVKYQNFIIDGQQKEVGIPSLSPVIHEYPYFSQLKDNLGIGVSLQINMPIYNKYAVKMQIQNAKIKIESEKLSQELLLQDLKTKILNAIADRDAAKIQYQAAIKTYEARKLAFDNAKERFENGIISSYDYINARILMNQAQNNMTLAKYQYLFKTMILNFYAENELSF